MPRSSSSHSRSPLGVLSFRIFFVKGTEVRAHFFLLIGVSFLFSLFEKVPIWMPWFVLTLLGCILIHDIVRITIARRSGLHTSELILLPTGGITTFSDHPKPAVDLAINIGGIMTSIMLAAVFGLVARLNHESTVLWHISAQRMTLLQALYLGNLALATINLCPVFPFDGGFLFRAILAFRYNERKATTIVGRVSVLFALGLVISAVFMADISLLIPALYIFAAAGYQTRQAGSRVLLKGKRVQDAMQVNFATLESGMSLGAAADEMLQGSQHDFPVVVGDEVIGVLTRVGIAQGIARYGPSGYVAGQMTRDFPRILPDAELEEAANLLNSTSDIPLMVMDGDSLVGLLSREKLNEYMMLLQARWMSSRRERTQ